MTPFFLKNKTEVGWGDVNSYNHFVNKVDLVDHTIKFNVFK